MKFAQREFPITTAIALILIAISRTALAIAPATAPTTQEIQNDFDAKQYRDAIKKIVAALALKNEAITADYKVAMLVLKAESHLQLKQYSLAADAFAAAAKQANPKQANKFKATCILIRKSANGQYQPKQSIVPGGGKLAPISIVDVASREDAIGALFTDERKFTENRVEALKKQNNLEELLEAIKQTDDLRVLEMAVGNKNSTTEQLILPLTNRANALMSAGIDRLSSKTDELEGRANQKIRIVSSDTGVLLFDARRGLHDDEKEMLRDIIASAGYVVAKCDDFNHAAKIDSQNFDSNKKRATDVAKRADTILNANYGS